MKLTLDVLEIGSPTTDLPDRANHIKGPDDLSRVIIEKVGALPDGQYLPLTAPDAATANRLRARMNRAMTDQGIRAFQRGLTVYFGRNGTS